MEKLKSLIKNLQRYPSQRRRRLIQLELRKIDRARNKALRIHEIYLA